MPSRAAAENQVCLTKTAVAGLVLDIGQSERIVWDTEVRGFGIRLRKSGNRAWVIRPPRSGGSSKLHTLGPADTIELGRARIEARKKLAQFALGDDPTKARREARTQAAVTLGSLIPVYIADREKHLRPASVANMKNHLNAHWRPLHEKPLAQITRAEVAARHREIASEHPHAADRARSILGTFFGWAIGEGLVDANPVTNTNKATKPTTKDRVLSDPELAAVWRACRDDDFGWIVKLLTLTGLRLNEVAGMRWSELDRLAVLWTIPKARMKGKRSHEVPLSRAALDILAGIPERHGRDLVFGSGHGPFSGFSKAKAAIDKRLGLAVAGWTLHDIRRTVDTRMNDIGILPHVVSEVLSHKGEHKRGVSGTYNHAAYRAEKREALNRWADHISVVVGRAAT